MRYLSMVLFAALLLQLIGCKAEFQTDQNGNPVPEGRYSFQVFCSKFVRINLDSLHHRIVSVDEHPGRSQAGEQINSTDFIGEMTYRLREYSDGSRDMECILNDGSRQYFGTSSVAARNAPYSDNLCSVMYDLEGNGTGGTFYFYWQNTSRGLTYADDYQGYTKELRVSSSECSEF